jgi:hypothetical protein
MKHTQNHSTPWKTVAIAGGIIAVTIIALLVFLLMRKEPLPANDSLMNESDSMTNTQTEQNNRISDSQNPFEQPTQESATWQYMKKRNWTTQTQRQVVEYFQGYTMAFPDGWYVETQSFEEPPSVISTIQNDTTAIEITQGPSSAGRCIFPEDPDSQEQMMGSEYGPYEVIQKGSTVWRYTSAIGSDGSEKIVCEKQDDGSFLAVTDIGYITVQNPEPSTEGEVIEILERLQIE